MATSNVKLSMMEFGVWNNEIIKEFTWTAPCGIVLKVISYGATITQILVPDKKGDVADVTLGYDDMAGYTTDNNPYFGATVGRVANRTGNSSFVLNGQVYILNANRGKHHLHGGNRGFDKVNWNAYVSGTKVTFSYLSPAGEEGYPGNLLTNVVYDVEDDGSIIVDMVSRCTEPTPVNLTNHAYFNLAGHNAGAEELYKHVFKINASNYTPLSDELITTGEIRSVDNTYYDLRSPKALSELIPKSTPGFDINYCLDIDQKQELTFIAKVHHPGSGRILKMYGNKPGVQFYTSNFLPETDGVVVGKNHVSYKKHGAFCLEPQNYPNAINHSHFPNSVLYPGEQYNHKFVYKFGTI